jgi:hypothetical protein
MEFGDSRPASNCVPAMTYPSDQPRSGAGSGPAGGGEGGDFRQSAAGHAGEHVRLPLLMKLAPHFAQA